MKQQTATEHKVNNTFVINTKLPGFNQLIDAAKRGPNAYARLKKKYTKLVIRELIRQNCVPDHPYDNVRISMIYYEGGSNRDPDNINSGAMKFICDAIDAVGIVEDDDIHRISFGPIEFRPDFGEYKIEVIIYHK